MGVTHSPLLEPHRTIGAMAPCLGAVVVDKGLFVPRNVDLTGFGQAGRTATKYALGSEGYLT